MRSIFKIGISLLIFINIGFSIGTQFLSIPQNSFELISGYNPAHFNSPNRPVISATYGNWLADVMLTNINISNKYLKGYGGINLRYVALDDIELRAERPSDDPISYYSSAAYAIDAWYMENINTISLSLTARYLSIQLYDETSDGFAVDLGANININEQYKIGVAILNLGYMTELYKEKPQLPLRTLISANTKINAFKIVNDVSFIIEKSSFVDGLIIRLSDYINYNNFQFMVGSQFANKNITVSGGINFSFGSYSIGYAVSFGSQALGIPQYLTLSINLP